MWLEGWKTGGSNEQRDPRNRRRPLNRALSLTDLPDGFSPYCFAQETDQTEDEPKIGKSDVLHDFASVPSA